VSQQKTKKMARRKKDIVWPHLNDAGGRLEKSWYVEYALRDPVTDKMERIRHYDKFKEISTDRERRLYASKIIKKLTADIKSGKIGFNVSVEYHDMLTYAGASFARKKKTHPESFKLYISEFLEYKRTEITGKSLQTYQSKFRIFASFLESRDLGDKPVTLVTNDLIIEFLKATVTERNLARKSVEKYQQILYTFFDYLIRKKKLGIENPVLNIPRMGNVKDEASSSIPRNMRLQLQGAIKLEDPQLWMAISFIYYAAIRPGTELRLMKLKQINYDSKTCIVRNYLSKNGRTEAVAIPDQLHQLITEEWKLQDYDQELYIFGKDGEPGPEPLGKNTMRIRFNAFRDRLNLPKDIHYYSWKHSGAQELADDGASIYEIQRHLRHRDITTTEQYLKKRIGPRSDAIQHHFPSI
jgi:integrase